MKEIILIVFSGGLFIFFVWFFIKLNKQPKKKHVKETENKPIETKKDEVPEILKEVTMGNYMFDISQNDVIDGIELPENESLDKPIEKPLDNRNSIEKAFDDITDVGSDYDEIIDDNLSDIEESGSALLGDIEDNFSDGVLLGEEYNDENNNKKSIYNQYKGLSKEMKIMLISNILKKKK